MMNIGLQQQQQIRGADGTILWSGAQVVGQDYRVTNNDTAAFVMGEGVVWDPQTVALGFIPRQETTAAGATPASDLPGNLVIGGKRIASATDVAFLGVAQEPIGIGKEGLVAGPGSLTTMLVTATAIALGACVGGSATAGLGAAVAKGTAGLTLGICIKINTTGVTGTGSTAWAGVLVAPA